MLTTHAPSGPGLRAVSPRSSLCFRSLVSYARRSRYVYFSRRFLKTQAVLLACAGLSWSAPAFCALEVGSASLGRASPFFFNGLQSIQYLECTALAYLAPHNGQKGSFPVLAFTNKAIGNIYPSICPHTIFTCGDRAVTSFLRNGFAFVTWMDFAKLPSTSSKQYVRLVTRSLAKAVCSPEPLWSLLVRGRMVSSCTCSLRASP